MSVTVRLSDSSRQPVAFAQADAFQVASGHLHVVCTDNQMTVGVFAPGSWEFAGRDEHTTGGETIVSRTAGRRFPAEERATLVPASRHVSLP